MADRPKLTIEQLGKLVSAILDSAAPALAPLGYDAVLVVTDLDADPPELVIGSSETQHRDILMIVLRAVEVLVGPEVAGRMRAAIVPNATPAAPDTIPVPVLWQFLDEASEALETHSELDPPDVVGVIRVALAHWIAKHAEKPQRVH